MFYLVTGASGAGKSTVRRILEAKFEDDLVMAELATLGITPEWNLAWRHRMVERVVRLALDAQTDGRPFLFCGDPVPPGELFAAPSANELDRIAVCLLDVAEEAQRRRLIERGDDPTLLPNHVAFAEWMRAHHADPGHRPDVITTDGWEGMRWDRWQGLAEWPWKPYVVDTTAQSPDAVAARVASWIDGASRQ